MNAIVALILLLTPSIGFARGSSGGAFWVLLSLPFAGLIASGIAALSGRKGQIDLGAFLIGLFIASPIVAGVGLWLAKNITAAFVHLTEDIPTWAVWTVAIVTIAIVGRAIEYRDRKRKAGGSGNA